jgi:hypothetical protein
VTLEKRASSSRSKYAYALFRELGNRQLSWRRQELKFEKLHPCEYHQIKSTIKTEQEWRKKSDAHIAKIYADKQFNLTDKQRQLFNVIRANKFIILKEGLKKHYSLEELLVKDLFWTKLNPLSSHQPDVSEETRQVLWEFVVSKCASDTLALAHWAIRLHLPTQTISDLLDQLAIKMIAVDTLHDDAKDEWNEGTDARPHLHTQQWTLLEKACLFDQLETVRLLLNRGANPDGVESSDSPPLTIACRNGNTELVELLLKHRAHPHLVDYDEEMPDYLSPLHYAAAQGDLKMAELLLEYGAEIDYLVPRVDIPRTPLAHACQHNQLEMVNFLLRHGANVNTAGDCVMPLELASEKGFLEIVKILVAAGAQLDQQDIEVPFFESASSNGHEEVARFLLEKTLELPYREGDENRRGYFQRINEGFKEMIEDICEDNSALLFKFITHPYYIANRSFDEIRRSTTAYAREYGLRNVTIALEEGQQHITFSFEPPAVAEANNNEQEADTKRAKFGA